MAVEAVPPRSRNDAPQYYPVFLNLTGRSVLVIGGGEVAERKVHSLLRCGARVRVLAPEATPELQTLSEQRSIDLVRRAYADGDLKGCFLVIAATDDEDVNRRVFAQANAANIPCNVVDVPELCSFIVPSVVSRGDLSIAISTNGKSPSFARIMRKRLEAELGPEYGHYLELLGSLRGQVKRSYPTAEERQRVWERIHQSEALEALRAGDPSRAREIVETCL